MSRKGKRRRLAADIGAVAALNLYRATLAGERQASA